jgi:phage FluMu protein Com
MSGIAQTIDTSAFLMKADTSFSAYVDLDFPSKSGSKQAMDQHRCPKCKKLLMAMTDRTGKTQLRCLKCDRVDPMKTDAVKWAIGGLSGPTEAV